MNEKMNALLVTSKDTVAVTTEELHKGDIACFFQDGQRKKIILVTDVPIYHKFSIVDIPNGEKILKYGQSIGRSTTEIPLGSHVHSHNLVSIREAIQH